MLYNNEIKKFKIEIEKNKNRKQKIEQKKIIEEISSDYKNAKRDIKIILQ